MLQWRARQVVGVMDAIPCAGRRRGCAVTNVKVGCNVSFNVATSESLIGSIGYKLNLENSSIGCLAEPVDHTGTRSFKRMLHGKKTFETRVTFFSSMLFFFLRASVSNQVNKESMIRRFNTPRQSRYRYAGHCGYQVEQTPEKRKYPAQNGTYGKLIDKDNHSQSQIISF